jgi:acyl-CoA thioester hydrolase
MLPTTQPPSYDEVLALPPVREDRVSPDFIDENGHMNVRHYLDYGARGADRICRDVGIDDDYRATRRMGLFTAEHHIRYYRELHEGDPLSVHTLFLERSSRAGHMMSLILDRRRQVLACTVEIAVVHVDLDSRRSVPYPDDVATGIDGWIARAQDVPWPMPLSGAIGLRR